MPRRDRKPDVSSGPACTSPRDRTSPTSPSSSLRKGSPPSTPPARPRTRPCATARGISELPVTHVILTHAHFDHIGGLDAFTTDGATVIAQANFPGDLRNQNSERGTFPVHPGGRSHRAQVAVDHLVSKPETLTIGGVASGGDDDDRPVPTARCKGET
jgi:glyoxylase-like metal-dependent hydrolase (beta-lactamase superfamily II)